MKKLLAVFVAVVMMLGLRAEIANAGGSNKSPVIERYEKEIAVSEARTHDLEHQLDGELAELRKTIVEMERDQKLMKQLDEKARDLKGLVFEIEGFIQPLDLKSQDRLVLSQLQQLLVLESLLLRLLEEGLMYGTVDEVRASEVVNLANSLETVAKEAMQGVRDGRVSPPITFK